MRVRGEYYVYGAPDDPCDQLVYGETEDYSFTVLAAQPKVLELTLFLEGLYATMTGDTMRKARNASGDQFPGSIADQIIVELHHAVSPYALAGGPYTVDLNVDGSCAILLPLTLNSYYYVVIKHRNSLETWSSSPINFANDSIIYNFTTSNDQSFGNNMKSIEGVYTLFGGDINQDGAIDAIDLIQIDNASKSFETGYLPADVDGNGQVNADDMIIIINTTKFINVCKPQ
jgi:hypothetical protein